MLKKSTLRHLLIAGLSLVMLLNGASQVHASGERADNRVIAGWVEKITLRSSGDQVKAKLDTGAKTSSINASKIKRFERDGDDWVRFTLEYDTVRDEAASIELERPVYRNIRVKEHEGENDRRAVVKLDFCFAGHWHNAQFSLVDRSRFVYPVLLGRRFLRDAAVIDPFDTFMTQPDCSETGKKS